MPRKSPHKDYSPTISTKATQEEIQRLRFVNRCREELIQEIVSAKLQARASADANDRLRRELVAMELRALRAEEKASGNE